MTTNWTERRVDLLQFRACNTANIFDPSKSISSDFITRICTASTERKSWFWYSVYFRNQVCECKNIYTAIFNNDDVM
ncbi:unnamed protein product [Rhizophagus irregularis]|nr:unnamed protein product [Rhizophagus irregularis]